MKLITAIVKLDMIDDLALAATDAGAHGLTATEVFGQQYGHSGTASSAGHPAVLLPKVRMDIVVQDEDAETVPSAIAKCANTGNIGDGKIWVSTVDSVIRVGAGERDNSAV